MTDRLVGKTARGRRPAIRWPKDLADLKKACAGIGVGTAILATGLAVIAIPLIVGMMFGFDFDFGVTASLALIAGGIALPLLGAWTVGLNLEEKKTGRVKKASEIMKPLLSEDSYLDLRLAAFLTVGAMPEWLRKQMDLDYEKYGSREEMQKEKARLARALRYGELVMKDHSRYLSREMRKPMLELDEQDYTDMKNKIEQLDECLKQPLAEWRKTRLAEEPYTVERAGLDYLELASSIELRDKAPDGSFHGKSFPGVNYRLPGSLKDAVGEIILFLSALPDSGEEPDEETMEAVVSTIDRMATIDGESFTEAARRLHEEAENKKKEEEDKARAEKKAAEDKAKTDYNSEIMRTVNATRDALAVENDDEYKEIQKGMARLGKISEAGEQAAESVATARAAAVSPTR